MARNKVLRNKMLRAIIDVLPFFEHYFNVKFSLEKFIGYF